MAKKWESKGGRNRKLEDYIAQNDLPNMVANALDKWVDDHRDKITKPAVCGIGVIVDETGKVSDTHLVRGLNGLMVYYDDETKCEVGTAVYARHCKAVHIKAWEIM